MASVQVKSGQTYMKLIVKSYLLLEGLLSIDSVFHEIVNWSVQMESILPLNIQVFGQLHLQPSLIK